MRKRFEKRWCVAWPADWKDMEGSMGAPLLFVYEDENGAKPTKVLDLATVSVQTLAHPREKQPHAFRTVSTGACTINRPLITMHA